MKYRSATLDDITQLSELEQCVVDAERPFNANIPLGRTKYYDLSSLISSRDAEMLVAENSGGIIATGYAKIQLSKESLTHDKHSYLGFMYVAPEYRGQGVNQTIMEMLISWSKSKGVNDFYLDVYSQNDPAIKAYQKLGFKPCLMEMKLNTK